MVPFSLIIPATFLCVKSCACSVSYLQISPSRCVRLLEKSLVNIVKNVKVMTMLSPYKLFGFLQLYIDAVNLFVMKSVCYSNL